MAGVRRHDPHRVDERRRAGPAIRWSPRWRRKVFPTPCPTSVVESFARHFMVAIDAWQEHGFGAVARSYLERLPVETGPAPRHRRERRSAGAPHGQDRRSSASSCCRGWPSRPGSIRQRRGRAREAVAHHTARSVRHLRVREGGRTGRMGGVGRLRVLGSRSGGARRQGALGVPRRISRPGLARLVDAGADRGGERCRSRRPWSTCWRSNWSTHFGAPDMPSAAAAAEEEVAFAESLCSQPQDTLMAVHRTFEDGEVRETFRTLRPRAGPKAGARVLLSRSRGRGRERRARRSI